MTLETTPARLAHEPALVRHAEILGVNFMQLARRMEADEQLLRALQVPGTALLGVASDGVPLLIRLASPDVTHLRVSGGRGSGKTELVKTILASLVLFQRPHEIQLFVIAGQASAFEFLAVMPHLNGGIASTPEQAVLHVRWLEAEMERRESEMVTRPHLIVVVDEMRGWSKENAREFQVRLTRLAQRGRAAGISLLVCGTDGNPVLVTEAFKGFFPVRVVGSAEKFATRAAFDLFAGGERVHFHAAYLAPNDIEMFQAQVRANLDPRKRNHSFNPGDIMRRLTRMR